MDGQKPSIGRTVRFTAHRGQIGESNVVDEYAAIITAVNEGISMLNVNPPPTVDLVTFGPNSVYFQHGIPYDSDGASMTWRWPPRD